MKGMVDISGKAVTVRTAVARGRITLGDSPMQALLQGRCPKGDVLETARIAAICAVKATPSIIPMCHPIGIEEAKVDFNIDQSNKAVLVEVRVKSSGKTGVEMEALTGASAGCLAIYDMLKFAGKDMVITDIRLLAKTGGKSGDYKGQD